MSASYLVYFDAPNVLGAIYSNHPFVDDGALRAINDLYDASIGGCFCDPPEKTPSNSIINERPLGGVTPASEALGVGVNATTESDQNRRAS